MKKFYEFIKESEESENKDLEYIEDVLVKLEDRGIKSTVEEGLFNLETKTEFYATSEQEDKYKSAKEWIKSIFDRRGTDYGYKVAYRIRIDKNFLEFKKFDEYYLEKLKILEETFSLLSKTYELYNFNVIKTEESETILQLILVKI